MTATKSKGLLALVVVTAVAVIVAAVLAWRGTGSGADREAGGAVLPGFGDKVGDADRIVLLHGDGKTTLRRKGDIWVVEEKSSYPADGNKLRQLLLGLSELRYVEPKTGKAELYSRLDLEDAGKAGGKSTLVTVSGEKAGTLAELIVGKRRTDALGGGVDGLYVRKPGDPQSWLARGTIDLASDSMGWLDPNLVDIPEEKIKDAVLTQPDGTKLHIARDKPEDKLAVKDAPANTKLRSEDAAGDPARALADLELSDVRAAADMPLPAEGVSHAEYTTFDGLTVDIALLDKDGKHWVHLTAHGTGDAEKKGAELNDKLSPWVYAILEYKAKLIETKLADLTAPPPKGS
jgi:hypothetical protein